MRKSASQPQDSLWTFINPALFLPSLGPQISQSSTWTPQAARNGVSEEAEYEG